MTDNAVTAGIVIIGDEIVKGQVQDCNSFYMCQRLHLRGVQVKTVVTIPDDHSLIGKYVVELSNKYTYVVTSGGIGPTHDDITFEAIASAYQDETRVNEGLEALYKDYFKDKYTDAHRKLSAIPSTASLFYNSGKIPLVLMKNIFILPGIPDLLKRVFASVEDHIGKGSQALVNRAIYLAVDEMSIASKLTQIDQQFPDVTIGSYPEWNSSYYKVKIMLESSDEDKINLCAEELQKQLPPMAVVDYNANPLVEPHVGLAKVCVGDLKEPLNEALEVCKEALDRYKLNEICIGFNGGKDCTALLHIWLVTFWFLKWLNGSRYFVRYINL